MEINQITGAIISSAMRVHTQLGPGLLESTYQACLVHELQKRGLKVLAEVGMPVIYDSVKLEVGYRIDLLVQDEVIVELKSVEALTPIHQAQLLTYLKLTGKKIGLLINFNVTHLRDGIKRMAN